MRLSDCRANLSEIDDTVFAGGLYPRKHLTILASAPGMGKTWLILSQALEYSFSGELLFGNSDTLDKTNWPDIKKDEYHSVIFCGEAGANVMAERIRALGVTPSENFQVYTQTDLFRNDVNICLDTEEGLENFSKIVAGEKADLVFIDTLISFRSEDESDQKTASIMLGGLRRVAEDCNCAIVLSHHLRKRKARERNLPITQDDIIGTGAFTRLASIAYTLSPVQFSESVLFSCVKSWWRKPEPHIFAISSNGKTVTLQERHDPNREDSGTDRARAFLMKLTPGGTITINQLADEVGCSGDIARKVIREAISTGQYRIHWVQDGIKYFQHIQETNP